MFTGIVRDVGRVVASRHGRLCIVSAEIAEDAALGDSIAVNGVDLTLCALARDEMSFDVMPETFRRTNLGDLRAGAAVNLEPSVRLADRLSGHLVRGVVEATGRLLEVHPDCDALIARYQAPHELMRYVALQGPVCVDGASLTVIEKREAAFSVSLVRYTQAHTNHAARHPGERVNLETDLIARYVDSLSSTSSQRLP
jgi:riboflavin synthase